MDISAVSRSSSSPSIRNDFLPDELQDLPYFHPDINSMQDVFAIVKKYVDKDGHFLLRRSFTKPGTLTFSVLHGNGVKHFSIAKQNGNYFLKDKQFPSISDLAHYYRTHDVPNVEGILNVRLLTPIVWRRPSMTSFKSTTTHSLHQSHKDPVSITDGSFGAISRLSNPIPGNQTSASGFAKESTKPRSNSLNHSKNKFTRSQYLSRGLQNPCESSSFDSSMLPDSWLNLSRRPLPRKPSIRCNERPLPAIPSISGSSYLYYSTVRDPSETMAEKLIKMLREGEEDEERCICGLLVDEAELIMGWTMHLSTEPESKGKLFFMGPEEQTAWELPLEISTNLSSDHRERIRKILQRGLV